MVYLKETTFNGGKGPVLALKGEACVDFYRCKWANLSGVAVQAGEKVAAKLTASSFSKVDMPVEAGAESRLSLNSVTMQDSKTGIVLKDHAELVADDVSIAGCEEAGLIISSTGAVHMTKTSVESRNIGILCGGMSTPAFSRVSVSAKNNGLLLQEDTLCKVSDVSVKRCSDGIDVRDTAKLRLIKGTITDCTNALIVGDHSDVELHGLTIGEAQSGLTADGHSSIRAESSFVSAYHTAIMVKDFATLTGKQTVAEAGRTGIHLLGETTVNLSDLQTKMNGSEGTCLLIEGKPAGTIDGLATVGGNVGMSVDEKVDLRVKNIDISDAREIGLSFFENANLSIDSGSITNCPVGADMSQQACPRLDGITFLSCFIGITCAGTSAPRINNCTIKGSITGVTVKEKSVPIISRLQVVEASKPSMWHRHRACAVEYLNESAGELVVPTIMTDQEYGIIICDDASPSILGADGSGHIKGCGNGIAVLGTGRPLIYNLTIDGNMQNGIFIQGKSKASWPASAYISGCRLRNHLNGAGVYLGKNSEAYILGLYRKDTDYQQLVKYAQNIVRSNMVGIMLTADAKACIDGNMIERNGTGIEIGEASRARVHRNHIRESKFVEMDIRGEGIIVKDNANAIITENNLIYNNRMSGILLTTEGDQIQIENNEIYGNVSLPEGSELVETPLGAVMISNECKVDLINNYIHDNGSPGITITEVMTGAIRHNLIERNNTSALHLIEGDLCTVENNTLVGHKRDDSCLLLGSGGKPDLDRFYFHNNIIYKFSKAFDSAGKMKRLPKKWAIQRNCIHNCDLEVGPNLPDLFRNYQLDPIFHNPNGKGRKDFTPESGSKVCDSTPRYDWGKIGYCGALHSRSETEDRETVALSILSPSQDGDIVSRQLHFEAEVKAPKGKKMSSWGLFVNNDLVKQSRGIQVRQHIEDYQVAMINTEISSLPYGESTIRLVVNSETGEQWSAERVVHTAKCSELHKRWVLLVGISDYSQEGSIPDLSYAAADAVALGELLSRRSSYAPNQDVEVIVLTNEQATREGLRQALFGKIAPCARADDEVIIFFAGHGVVDQDRFYLALYDSDLISFFCLTPAIAVV
jgi:nitrous oxidase accessory protein NosD